MHVIHNTPAIIACADETLIEQLVKKEGDIAKLEKALHLNIDVRLAKSRDQYLCLNKLDKIILYSDEQHFHAIHDRLPDFIHGGQGRCNHLNDMEIEKIILN